jgi:hypothetical protein
LSFCIDVLTCCITSLQNTITKLSMSANGITGDVGGKAISDVLEFNIGLFELSVSDNNGEMDNFDRGDGPLFFQALSHGLKTNMTLTTLDVSGNGLGELQLPPGWTYCARFICNEMVDTMVKAGAARMESVRQGFGPLDPGENNTKKQNTMADGWADVEGADGEGGGEGGNYDTDDDIILSSSEDEDEELRGGRIMKDGDDSPEHEKRALFSATAPARLFAESPPSDLLAATAPTPAKFDVLAATATPMPTSPEQRRERVQELDALSSTTIAASSYRYTHTDGRKQNDAPGAAKQGGLLALAGAIAEHGTLTKLNIARNSIGGIGGQKLGAQALADALKVNTTLKELDISGNSIDSQDIRIIASGMLVNDTLNALHIGSNNISKDGMYLLMCVVWQKENIRSLCEVPIKDITVEELDVSRYGLGVEGASAAMWYTSINQRLHKIDIRYNGIPRETQQELEEICAGRRILLTR